MDDLNESLKSFNVQLINQIEDLDGDGTEDPYDEDVDGDGFSNKQERNWHEPDRSVFPPGKTNP